MSRRCEVVIQGSRRIKGLGKYNVIARYDQRLFQVSGKVTHCPSLLGIHGFSRI